MQKYTGGVQIQDFISAYYFNPAPYFSVGFILLPMLIASSLGLYKLNNNK